MMTAVHFRVCKLLVVLTLCLGSSLRADTVNLGFLSLVQDTTVQYFLLGNYTGTSSQAGYPVQDALSITDTELVVTYLDAALTPHTATRVDSGAPVAFSPGLFGSVDWYFDLSWVLTSVQFRGRFNPLTFATDLVPVFVSTGQVSGHAALDGANTFAILTTESAAPSPVPEPGYMALLAIGMATLLYRVRR